MLALVLPRDPESEERDTVAAGVALGPELRLVSAQGRVRRQTDRMKLRMPAMVLPEEGPQNWNLELLWYPRAMHVVVVVAAAAAVAVAGGVRFRRMDYAVVSPLPFVVPVVAAVEAACIAAVNVAAAGMEAVDCRYFPKEQELRPCR